MRVDPVAELYDLVLQVPSVFGRLIHIANLWNPHTGRYDRSLPNHFRSAEVDKAVANWHHVFFTEWLSLTLEQKETDIALYWTSMGGMREQIKTIRREGEAAIPPLVRAEERGLFMQDLALIVAFL